MMGSNEKNVEAVGEAFYPEGDPNSDREVFGDDKNHQIKYRTLSWQFTAYIMITEIVTGGTVALPQALAVVGWVPGLIVLIFCGVFALYTSLILVDFKINHPEVHNMGDAGYLIFQHFHCGILAREILSFGTLLFCITAVAAMEQLTSLALSTLSNNKLCLMTYTGISAIATLLAALPRTLNQGPSYFSAVACISVIITAVVAMVGAGVSREPGREVKAVVEQDFYTAFLTITNPVIAFAGHFMFFPLISEMKNPHDAKKSAYALQTFSTLFYALFALITYIFIGSSVQNPSLLSLPSKWAKASWGLFIPNLLIAASLYNHVAAKMIFVRIFRGDRGRRHLTDHTVLGWGVWTALCVGIGGVGFVVAVGVPIFAYLAGISAALFASWYTYGLAGIFWLFDTYFIRPSPSSSSPPSTLPLPSSPLPTSSPSSAIPGFRAYRKHWLGFILAILTIAAGAFICIGGNYAIITSLVRAYQDGEVGRPFVCSAGV